MTTVDEPAEVLTIDDAYQRIDRHLYAIAALRKAVTTLLAAQEERISQIAGFDGVDLTPTEIKVARLLDSALTVSDIARELYVSANTVKTHMKHIYHKLNVSRRREAVAALKARAAS